MVGEAGDLRASGIRLKPRALAGGFFFARLAQDNAPAVKREAEEDWGRHAGDDERALFVPDVASPAISTWRLPRLRRSGLPQAQLDTDITRMLLSQ
jgi:hypothetical protein